MDEEACISTKWEMKKVYRGDKKSGNRLRFPLWYIKESRTEDMNKLRVTGFECFAVFVIRCAMHAPKGAACHWQRELVSELKILMSLPIEQVRLNSFSVQQR